MGPKSYLLEDIWEKSDEPKSEGFEGGQSLSEQEALAERALDRAEEEQRPQRDREGAQAAAAAMEPGLASEKGGSSGGSPAAPLDSERLSSLPDESQWKGEAGGRLQEQVGEAEKMGANPSETAFDA